MEILDTGGGSEHKNGVGVIFIFGFMVKNSKRSVGKALTCSTLITFVIRISS